MTELTPARAIAAAIITAHPDPIPHWAGIAAGLREWANENDQRESEMPSQDTTFGPKPSKLWGIKQAPSGVLVGPPAQGSNPYKGGAVQHHTTPEGPVAL